VRAKAVRRAARGSDERVDAERAILAGKVAAQ